MHAMGRTDVRGPAISDRATGVIIDDAPESVAKQRIMPMAYRRLFAGGALDDEERFLEGIAQRFDDDINAFPIGRARAGIYLLARHAVSGDRRRVLMSPFTIPDVV